MGEQADGSRQDGCEAGICHCCGCHDDDADSTGALINTPRQPGWLVVYVTVDDKGHGETPGRADRRATGRPADRSTSGPASQPGT